MMGSKATPTCGAGKLHVGIASCLKGLLEVLSNCRGEHASPSVRDPSAHMQQLFTPTPCETHCLCP